MKKIINLIFLFLLFVFAQNNTTLLTKHGLLICESVLVIIHLNGCLLIKFPGKKNTKYSLITLKDLILKRKCLCNFCKTKLKQPPIMTNESIFKYVTSKIISKTDKYIYL